METRSRARAIRGIAVIAVAALSIALAGPPVAPAAGTLVHAYHGDGDAKDAVLGADASDGVLMGSATFGTGHLGQAFAFAGSGDYVRIPSNPSFYPSGSFTVDGWLSTTAAVLDGVHEQATLAVLYECAQSCPTNQANSVWQVAIYDGLAYGYVRDTDASGPVGEGGGEVATAGPMLNDGALHRITMVRDMDAQVLALYADGTEVAERPLNAGADGALSDTDGENDPVTLGATLLGGTNTPVGAEPGAVDEVRYLTGTDYPDTTPPVITPVVTGPAGNDGWLTGTAPGQLDHRRRVDRPDEDRLRPGPGRRRHDDPDVPGDERRRVELAVGERQARRDAPGGHLPGRAGVRDRRLGVRHRDGLGRRIRPGARHRDGGGRHEERGLPQRRRHRARRRRERDDRSVPVHGQGRNDPGRDLEDRRDPTRQGVCQPATLPHPAAQRQGDADRRRPDQAQHQVRALGARQGTRAADRPDRPAEGDLQGDDHRHRRQGRQARRVAHLPHVHAEAAGAAQSRGVMKAVVCQNAELSVSERPEPVPARGQVRIRTLRCGICGSDLHARHGIDDWADTTAKMGYRRFGRSDEPVVFGHEFCGEIAEYGVGCRSRSATGTHVVALPLLRGGGGIDTLGLSTYAPGAYADQLLVEESLMLPVPNGLQPDVAALTEPMAVAWHAVRRGEVGKRTVAVVIGCGPIGLGGHPAC